MKSTFCPSLTTTDTILKAWKRRISELQRRKVVPAVTYNCLYSRFVLVPNYSKAQNKSKFGFEEPTDGITEEQHACVAGSQ